MKFNKFIAFGVCAMMAFSTIASAANNAYIDEEGYAIIDVIPTQEEVEARTSNVKATVTSYADQDAMKAAGASFGRKDSFAADSYDFYKVDLTVNNFGDLIYGTGPDPDYTDVEIRLYNVTLDLVGLSEKPAWNQMAANSADSSSISWNQFSAMSDGTLVFSWDNAKSPCPSYTDAAKGAIDANNASVAVSYYLIVADGTNVELTPSIKTFYYYANPRVEGKDSANAISKSLALTASTDGVESTNGKIKLAPATTPDPEPETIGVDATLLVSNDVAQEGITTNGYIWKVDLTNAASISDFKATFKAGEENAERKIRNMKALTAAMGGEGAYSFNVGLNTKKTGVTAKFEVTDGTNTAVWPAE